MNGALDCGSFPELWVDAGLSALATFCLLHGVFLVCFFSRFMFNHCGFPGDSVVKKSACQCRRHSFHPWVRKIPWRRKWQTAPVFLPGKSHGQRSLVGYSPWGHKESDTTEKLNNNIFFMVFIFQLIWCITLIDLYILKNPCIPGINRTWSWYMCFLMCCWIVS